ncbi:MAG TPA: hypothetical protein VH309_10810, partial [Elusimicrobiota bacterium]|nr:hypothetical protein [Elusimicrobiota bacterium]
MPHRTSSTLACQILLGSALVLAAASGASADPAAGAFAAPKPYVEPAPQDIDALLKRLAQFRLFGSASVNWRNVGPRTPGYETQIQDEVYLADMYFGVEGPVLRGVPFHLEMNAPTALQGNVQLYQMFAEYDRIHRIKLQA